jgi:phosphonoacetaldehyde hydrolase
MKRLIMVAVLLMGGKIEASDCTIKLINFDTGGVRGDDKCLQPVKAFIAGIESLGIAKEKVMDVIYGFMGMGKKPHLKIIVNSQQGGDTFHAKHGRAPQDTDVDAAYKVFVDTQRGLMEEGYPIIDGCVQVEKELKTMGILIGNTTGFPSELRDLANKRLAQQGSHPDVSVASDEVSSGRPGPWLIYKLLEKAYKLTGSIIKPSQVLTVDDTAAGIKAGVNAGTWCVGVAGTSILHNQTKSIDETTKILLQSGAHFVVNSIIDVPKIVRLINTYQQKHPLVTPENFKEYSVTLKDTEQLILQ